MEDIFIKSIHINRVRHLENVEIPISETERKHLILTGKNGSGKTSVLLEIRNWLVGIEDEQFFQIPNFKQNILKLENENIRLLTLGYAKAGKRSQQDNRQQILLNQENIKQNLQELERFANVNIEVSDLDILNVFKEGGFILTYFGSKRNLQLTIPKGINKVLFKDSYSVDENAGKNFLQHIVNLKADLSFAYMANEKSIVNDIDNWFENFEKNLKDIFEDDNLKLEFDTKNYNFKLINDGHKASDFTTLSDGYSAIFNIISELIMRMDNKASKSYDIQGIVLIDEIETHLHIDLQKKILPFLTNFFPKIQFIVTTHSPFVLNSIKNAVVFDLEKKIPIEDMTGYSINSIVESYFDSDNYSTVVKEKVIEYENLLNKSDLNEEEEEKLFDLKRYFKDLPKMFSPELALKINQLTLANLSLK